MLTATDKKTAKIIKKPKLPTNTSTKINAKVIVMLFAETL